MTIDWDSLPEEFKAQIKSVTAKRPKTVIDHILKFGHISTEDLREQYGYNHPPRAARDVRELGIPLETFKVTGSDGRTIGAYRFNTDAIVEAHKSSGRVAWDKNLKQNMLTRYGSKCSICLTEFDSQFLQIDHRVPYQVAGDVGRLTEEDVMLVCGSCNRRKSWTCENCKNGIEDRSSEVCRVCYWASPDDYEHVALSEIRRLEIVWTHDELSNYKLLEALSGGNPEKMTGLLKSALRDSIEREAE